MAKKEKAAKAAAPAAPKKKSNGLKTAVKYGEITPEQALEKLKKLAASPGGLPNPELEGWLKRYGKKPKAEPKPEEELVEAEG